jgi:hypothetical protein
MQLTLEIVVVLIAVSFAAVGLGFMFIPATVMSQPGFSVVPDGVAGLSTARSILGGHFIAMASLCIYSLRKRANDVLYGLGVIVSFVVLGRLISLIMDGFNTNALGGLVIETLVLTGLFAAGRLLQAHD